MEYQICKKCFVNKELIKSNFERGQSNKNGIIKFYWYKACKVCDHDRILAKIQRYKSKNRKKLADQQKTYHLLNKSKDSETKKKWYQKNKEKTIARVKKNMYARRARDPIFRMKQSISANIRGCMKKNHQPLSKFLPYTILELKEHLEKQFEPWMTWNNYGVYRVDIWNDNDQSTWTWQIDHIISHSKFNYISKKDKSFQECWSLSNLRPYSAKQNVIDGER